MKSEVTIRFATQKDKRLLAQLGRETFHEAFAGNALMPAADLKAYLNEAFNLTQITRDLSDPKAIFLLAEVAGEAVGYAKLITGRLEPNIAAKNPIKLKRLNSKQEFIGAGIGAALMRRCLGEAAARKHDTIWLTVWEHNLRAQAFYRKWNFESCGSIDFQLGKTVLTDILMHRAVHTLRTDIFLRS
jgi:diamine N-acetyltransferase